MSQKQAAGQSIPAWCADADISRITFHRLPEDRKPRHVRIGRRVVIYETAADWLKRMASSGPIELRRAA